MFAVNDNLAGKWLRRLIPPRHRDGKDALEFVIIALMRKRTDARLIFLVNLFFGWTAIGWLSALVWAFLSNNRLDEASAYFNQPRRGAYHDIKRAHQLLEKGVITQEEFDAAKSKLLRDWTD